MIKNRKIQTILFILRDKNKKSWFKIIKESISLYLSKKELPIYYFYNLLYRKNIKNYNDYLSLKENNVLLDWSHSLGADQIVLVENKLLFEEFLVKHDIPTPKIFLHNSKSKFTHKGNKVNVVSKNDFLTLLYKIFNEENTEKIFCKPIDGEQGKDIFVLDRMTYAKITDDVVTKVLSNSYIFQEAILQHKVLNKLNDSCVNTLRIATYKNTKNEVEILSIFIRIGRKGAIIDNAHAGGIVVSMNNDSGKLYSEGIQLITNGGGIFYRHPDSQIIFKDYEIPYFNELKQLVTKAATPFNFPLLGWDVALTPNGPIIIEVNHSFHLLLSDRMSNGLKRNPTFKELALYHGIK
jgi:hypothetical protein